jgi:hypothetical protein
MHFCGDTDEKGCFSSTTTSSSVAHGRLTPEEREAEKRSEDPRKVSL